MIKEDVKGRGEKAHGLERGLVQWRCQGSSVIWWSSKESLDVSSNGVPSGISKRTTIKQDATASRQWLGMPHTLLPCFETGNPERGLLGLEYMMH